MVRISSNGDILPDGDPRENQSARDASQTEGLTRRGFVQHDAEDAQPHHHMPQGNIFDTINQRLLTSGVPRWNLGPYPVEPIASLGFLAALLILGFKGLGLGLLLFFVCKWSQGSQGGQGQQGGAQGGGRGWMGGGRTQQPQQAQNPPGGLMGGRAAQMFRGAMGQSGNPGNSAGSGRGATGQGWSGEGHKLGR